MCYEYGACPREHAYQKATSHFMFETFLFLNLFAFIFCIGVLPVGKSVCDYQILELQTVVCYHVDSGILTRVLWESS